MNTNQEQVSQVLKRFGLRRTPTRSRILDLYLGQDHALAHKDIETTLSQEFDRVTIYRTLHAFEEKGLIHKVHDGSASVKYALCGHECHEENHNHNHIHFTCNNCDKTFCVDEVNVPKINLPPKFKTENVYLYAKGLCDNCNV
jgi:Fur family ferric uptake transcriptional regulator